MRLHLIKLLGLGPLLCLLPSALAHHVESMYTPIKNALQGCPLSRGVQCPFGGGAGSRTRVHSAFTWKELQQYRYYTIHLFIGQPGPSYHAV